MTSVVGASEVSLCFRKSTKHVEKMSPRSCQTQRLWQRLMRLWQTSEKCHIDFMLCCLVNRTRTTRTFHPQNPRIPWEICAMPVARHAQDPTNSASPWDKKPTVRKCRSGLHSGNIHNVRSELMISSDAVKTTRKVPGRNKAANWSKGL